VLLSTRVIVEEEERQNIRRDCRFSTMVSYYNLQNRQQVRRSHIDRVIVVLLACCFVTSMSKRLTLFIILFLMCIVCCQRATSQLLFMQHYSKCNIFLLTENLSLCAFASDRNNISYMQSKRSNKKISHKQISMVSAIDNM
jgi:hypothetical protein